MNSLVDFTLSDELQDVPMSQGVILHLFAQISTDDRPTDDIAALQPANWQVFLPYEVLNLDNGKFFTKLDDVLEPFRKQYFKVGIDRLHEALTRYVLSRDLSKYAAKFIPDPTENWTIH